MKLSLLSLLIFIALLAALFTVKNCRQERIEDPHIKQLQADTAKLGKEVQILKLETKSLYARAVKAEQALYKPKEERKGLKQKLAEDKTVKDSVETLVKLDKKSDEVIERQDTVIQVLERVKLFQDSTINHLEAKVNGVKELDEIHLSELNKERRRSFWHRVKDITLPVLALILGFLIAK